MNNTTKQMRNFTKERIDVSLVIPIFNEQDSLEWHHKLVESYFLKTSVTYEIIYIDDGSNDGSLDIIKSLCAKSPTKHHYVALSKNFGKEAATSAGLQKVTGQVTIIIDGDGQHPVELITKFIEKWQEGFDVVIGLRESNEGEGMIKKYGSKLFYKLLNIVGGNGGSLSGTTDFRLIDQKVIKEFNKLTERNRVARSLIDWLGFNRTVVPFSALPRHAGKASYSIRKLFKLAINGIVAHSTRPLKLVGVLGLLISTVSMLALIVLIIEMYLLNDPLKLAVSGVAILALFLSFLIGVVLVCQGLLSLYLESVYHETQNRPLYVISEES